MALLYDGWRDLVLIAVTAPLVYLTVIVYVRLSGKRTTSQMNNFDWIVTVAMGAMVGTTILSRDVKWAELALALGVLLALEYGITTLVRRNRSVAKLVKAPPTLLYHRGTYCEEPMRGQRITREELRAAARAQGHARMENVVAIILESDASFSVLSDTCEPSKGTDLLDDVEGAREAALTSLDASGERERP